MNKHSRNTISDRPFFLDIEANVLLRIFYYNALGTFLEALVQRTGCYTNLLQGASNLHRNTKTLFYSVHL